LVAELAAESPSTKTQFLDAGLFGEETGSVNPGRKDGLAGEEHDLSNLAIRIRIDFTISPLPES